MMSKFGRTFRGIEVRKGKLQLRMIRERELFVHDSGGIAGEVGEGKEKTVVILRAIQGEIVTLILRIIPYLQVQRALTIPSKLNKPFFGAIGYHIRQ